MEPRNYVGDNFSRVTPVYKVTQYNIACCYSMLGQVRPLFCWEGLPSRLINQSAERVPPTHTQCTTYSWLVCICSAQVDESLKSIEAALSAGFDNFEQIRKDKNLASLRSSPKFQVSRGMLFRLKFSPDLKPLLLLLIAARTGQV